MAQVGFWPRVRQHVNGWFEAEGNNADYDPLLDVVQEYPTEAVWFIKIVMFFGCMSGVLVAIPCCAFLALYWSRCGSCNRPLRYWVLMHCVLQLLQSPVRLVFFFRLAEIQRSDTEIHPCVRRLTSSAAWRASKTLSIVTYGWFILGVVWILNSTHCAGCPGLYKLALAVIFTAVARLLITLICFYHSFPPRFNVANPQPPVPRGASQDIIERIPHFKYSPERVPADANCAVCLCDFGPGDTLRALPCSDMHLFHRHCIDKWLKKNKVCPLCLVDVTQGETKKAK
jgi:hypothetical protein